jgi:hypothetical protein
MSNIIVKQTRKGHPYLKKQTKEVVKLQTADGGYLGT